MFFAHHLRFPSDYIWDGNLRDGNLRFHCCPHSYLPLNHKWYKMAGIRLIVVKFQLGIQMSRRPWVCASHAEINISSHSLPLIFCFLWLSKCCFATCMADETKIVAALIWWLFTWPWKKQITHSPTWLSPPGKHTHIQTWWTDSVKTHWKGLLFFLSS